MKLLDKLKKIREHQIASDKFLLAYQYNSLYFNTLSTDCRWMCPICNKVHYPKELNGFYGSIFDECCDFPKGPRNSKTCAIPKKLFHFWK